MGCVEKRLQFQLGAGAACISVCVCRFADSSHSFSATPTPPPSPAQVLDLQCASPRLPFSVSKTACVFIEHVLYIVSISAMVWQKAAKKLTSLFTLLPQTVLRSAVLSGPWFSDEVSCWWERFCLRQLPQTQRTTLSVSVTFICLPPTSFCDGMALWKLRSYFLSGVSLLFGNAYPSPVLKAENGTPAYRLYICTLWLDSCVVSLPFSFLWLFSAHSIHRCPICIWTPERPLVIKHWCCCCYENKWRHDAMLFLPPSTPGFYFIS